MSSSLAHERLALSLLSDPGNLTTAVLRSLKTKDDLGPAVMGALESFLLENRFRNADFVRAADALLGFRLNGADEFTETEDSTTEQLVTVSSTSDQALPVSSTLEQPVSAPSTSDQQLDLGQPPQEQTVDKLDRISIKSPPGLYKITKLGEQLAGSDSSLGHLQVAAHGTDLNQRLISLSLSPAAAFSAGEVGSIQLAEDGRVWHIASEQGASTPYDLEFWVEPVSDTKVTITFRGNIAMDAIIPMVHTSVEGVLEDTGVLSIIRLFLFLCCGGSVNRNNRRRVYSRRDRPNLGNRNTGNMPRRSSLPRQRYDIEEDDQRSPSRNWRPEEELPPGVIVLRPEIIEVRPRRVPYTGPAVPEVMGGSVAPPARTQANNVAQEELPPNQDENLVPLAPQDILVEDLDVPDTAAPHQPKSNPFYQRMRVQQGCRIVVWGVPKKDDQGDPDIDEGGTQRDVTPLLHELGIPVASQSLQSGGNAGATNAGATTHGELSSKLTFSLVNGSFNNLFYTRELVRNALCGDLSAQARPILLQTLPRVDSKTDVMVKAALDIEWEAVMRAQVMNSLTQYSTPTDIETIQEAFLKALQSHATSHLQGHLSLAYQQLGPEKLSTASKLLIEPGAIIRMAIQDVVESSQFREALFKEARRIACMDAREQMRTFGHGVVPALSDVQLRLEIEKAVAETRQQVQVVIDGLNRATEDGKLANAASAQATAKALDLKQVQGGSFAPLAQPSGFPGVPTWLFLTQMKQQGQPSGKQPTGEKPVPIGEKPVPIGDKPVPTSEKPLPTQSQPVPAQPTEPQPQLTTQLLPRSTVRWLNGPNEGQLLKPGDIVYNQQGNIEVRSTMVEVRSTTSHKFN